MPSKFCKILCISLFITSNIFSQTDISGTWFVNGKQDLTCTIFQNDNNLIFYATNSTSNGYFSNPYTLNATEWKSSALVTEGGKSIVWDNQIWTKEKITGYPSIAGEWSLDNNPGESYFITQDNIYFTIKHKDGNISGYFNDKSNVTVPKWNNAISALSADGNTFTWDNQTWSKKGNINHQQVGSNQKLCRFELSKLFYASQALGSVWGSLGSESPVLSMDAVTAIDAHLSLVDQTFKNMTCLVFDYNRIRNVRLKLNGTPTTTLLPELEQIIVDLQTVIQNLTISCDKGVHPLALYVSGIHIGAAQAWSSSRQCLPTPMPRSIQTAITNHLTTANNALISNEACIGGFDFSSFGSVNLGSINSIESHTRIVDIATQLLWAVSLSDCCCECSQTNIMVTNNNDCDNTCKQFCQSQGRSNGKFNNKTICLLGVVSGGNQSGCECW